MRARRALCVRFRPRWCIRRRCRIQVVKYPREIRGKFGKDGTSVTRAADSAEGNDPSLVSPYSLHGQWLARMDAAGISPETLDEQIRASLAAIQHVEPGDAPIGAVVPIDGAEFVYYLLAISKLDVNGNTQSSISDIESAVASLAKFYGARGRAFLCESS